MRMGLISYQLVAIFLNERNAQHLADLLSIQIVQFMVSIGVYRATMLIWRKRIQDMAQTGWTRIFDWLSTFFDNRLALAVDRVAQVHDQTNSRVLEMLSGTSGSNQCVAIITGDSGIGSAVRDGSVLNIGNDADGELVI